MMLAKFEGWKHYTVELPGESSLRCFVFRNTGNAESVYDENHNVFRLDKYGNVVWQIQRDEQGKLNWDAMHEAARSEGKDGAREPLMNLLVVHPDGTRKRDPNNPYVPLEVDVWEPGCRIYSNSLQGMDYEIEIDAGIARNITARRQRPW